ncbi:MAG: 4-hydroxy-tetrahydrodipicolinate reductase [Saprospiraceae bacterium]|nr:4-hydroxy-tetrahydrodipicolinate reductase [Saprospiraceae bacterium]
MRICLIGYGKMGKAIEHIALERGHQISGRISNANASDLLPALKDSDLAIEFTRPESAIAHLQICAIEKIPVVCGTTGWLKEWDSIKHNILENEGALVYSSNFSVGVQLFFSINKKLAEWMAKHPNYHCSIKEIHHIHKLDAPSGTAISLANDILQVHPSYKDWQLENSFSDHLLPIQSIRENEVVGTHFVKYQSEIDEIEIKHEAFTRTGFAKGAVLAAEWVLDKKGVYTMLDVLDLNAI